MSLMLLATISLHLTPLVPDEATKNWSTFRSTSLGFAFEHPSEWKKETPTGCGHDYKGLTQEDLARRALPVIYLSAMPPDPTLPGLAARVHVSHQRIVEQTASEYSVALRDKYAAWNRDPNVHVRADFTEFTTKSGIPGLKVTDSSQSAAGPLIASASFHFVFDGRLVVLAFSDGGEGLAKWEAAFDRAAASLEMFPPYADLPTEGVKTFNFRGASFEYPGNWIGRLVSSDDEEAMKSITVAPANNWLNPPASIALTFVDSTLDEYESRSRTSLGENVQMRGLAIVPFTNIDGVEGRKIQSDLAVLFHEDRPAHRMTWLAIACPGGGLATLFFWDRRIEGQNWGEVFARAETTFSCK